MGEIMKRTEEIRVGTEEEAMALIEQAKENGKIEGYELVSYTSTKKEKKQRGQVIDEYFLVKLVKTW